MASSLTSIAAPSAESGRTFPCETCGADLEYRIGTTSIACPYCGAQKTLAQPEQGVVERDYREALRRLAAQRQQGASPQVATQELTCRTCAATIAFAGTLTSTECAYCGSPVQRDEVHTSPARVPVDGVLPFAIDRTRARQALNAWVKSRWFAPNEFKRRGAQGKFNGIYFPFFTFDSMTATTFQGQRGDAYYVTVGSGENRRQERRVRWSSASGSFQTFFDDVLVCAASQAKRSLMEALEPWPLENVRPFDAGFLAGYVAMTYDRELDAGFEVAKERIDAGIEMEIRRRIGGDEQRILHVDTRYDAVTYKHLLLPAWILAYKFRNESYQVVVNACTGAVSGERPWSWVKIVFAVVSVAAVIGVIAHLSG